MKQYQLLKDVNIFGAVPIHDKTGKIVGHQLYPARFVFPKVQTRIEPDCLMLKNRGYQKCSRCRYVEDHDNCSYKTVSYLRIDNINRSWRNLKEKAGVTNLQFKDLRTYFNHILVSRYGLSNKEAGFYVGNTEEVNRLHYDPVIQSAIAQKMEQLSLKEAMGFDPESSMN